MFSNYSSGQNAEGRVIGQSESQVGVLTRLCLHRATAIELQRAV